MRKSDLVFFLSGAAALVDQTVWARLLGRLIGGDAAGVALVLAVFMAGLGLGAAAFGAKARQVSSPRKTFLLLQLGVASWTALSPFLLEAWSPVESLLGRALIAALTLLVPTFLMGATFPLMGRLSVRSDASVGSDTARFYGANTLGAAAGALLGPFLFMPSFGLRASLFAGAGLDLLAGVLAFLLLTETADRAAASIGRPIGRVLESAPQRFPSPNAALVATFLCGASALGLEVLATRLLISVTGASIHAFAIVLFAYLCGIGLGSRGVVDLLKSRSPEQVLRWATLALPALALFGLLLLRFQLGEANLFGTLQNRMPRGSGLGKLWSLHALLAALALIPPTLAFGAALPAAAACCVKRDPSRSRESWLGWVYAWNTAGSLIGALLFGFVLLPRVGLWPALLVALAAPWIAGLFLGGARSLPAAALALSAALGWFLAPQAATAEPAGFRVESFGPHATASAADEGPSVRSLRVNGKVVATTAPVDLRLQRLLALIPGLLHGEVQSARVVGLGTGMTAGALLDLPTLQKLEILEISPAVTEVAHAFDDWTGAVQDDPRTTVTRVDGRHRLARDAAQPEGPRFDLVTADPIHPWTRGSSDLYSLEHFENMAAILEPNGVASQWLPLYQLSEKDVKTIVATWCSAFEHTSAWLTAYDLALVGSRTPLATLHDLANAELPERAAASLAEAGVHSGPELVALHVADDTALRSWVAATPPMRDDRPTLEFDAPKSYLAGYSLEALIFATREVGLEGLPEASQARGVELRELGRNFVEELGQGSWSEAAERYGTSLLALPPLKD